jgi:hypothetical protein
MLLGKEAESEASVGGKPGIRVSLQEYPTGLVPQGLGAIPAPTGNHTNGDAHKEINCLTAKNGMW